MRLIESFLFFCVILNFSRDGELVAALKEKALQRPFENDSLRSKPIDEDNEDETSTEGTKRLQERNLVELQILNPNLKDSSSIVNENAPEIKGQDISPEQEIIMAAAQDSSYQQASIGDVNGQDLGTLTGRTLEHTSTPERQENGGENSQDVLDDEDALGSGSLLGFGNFSQAGGDSDELDDDSPDGIGMGRQLIHFPPLHGVRPLQPVMKAPMPYPATIHVRLPGNVRVVPRVYPVHDYRNVPVPFRYHKVQSLDSPYYVPYKAAPDVEMTHLHVFHSANPCKKGGLLMEGNGGMTCLCTREYRGRYCDEKLYCASNPCLYGGICDEIQNNYRCRCPKGYRGYNCEVKDECAFSPCKNDGTCVETLSGHKCICRTGFTGESCESPDFCVPNPCKNWGTCIQTYTGHHECQCTPHFKGHLCEKRRVCYANPCKNGGKCIEDGERYPCICPHGFKPPYCNDHVCSHHHCLNGGKCIAHGSIHGWYSKCICPLLYRGERCETPNPCVTNPCVNGGTCIDSYSDYSGFPGDWNARHLHYICVCPPGYFGPKCEDNICLKCHPNATCILNHCVCMDGFYGDGFYCRRLKDPCVPNPCYNNATCTPGPDGSYDCHCLPGYIPPLCKEKNPCIPNPCKNGGSCERKAVIHLHPIHIILPLEYTCLCPPGFAPPDCTNKTTDPCEPNPCLNGGTCRKDPTKKEGYVCECPGRHFVPPICRCDCPQGDPFNKPFPILPSHCDFMGEDCICTTKGYTFAPKKGCEFGRGNPCESNPCLNNGTCIAEGNNWRCQCPENCFGIKCNTCNFCPPNFCYNGGTCYTVGQLPYCRCPKEFLPPRCLIKIPVHYCHPNPCHNGGKCIERHDGYDCQCFPPFDGPHCEHDKCMDCDVHAICVLGHCKCRKGYRGNGYKGDCIKESGCAICPVNAMCVDNSCQCVPGFMLAKHQCIPVAN